MPALRRTVLTLSILALSSASAQALIANDPPFFCEQTGGTWNACGSGCGPLTCETPSRDPETACPTVCVEQCDCPEDAPLWKELTGCIAESDCEGGQVAEPMPPGMALCEQTGGTWDWCGSGCGPMGCGDDPTDFEVCDDVCVEQCACPEGAPLWDADAGCISESDCVDSPQKSLCDATGGEWQECGSGCGPRTCEAPTLEPDVDCPAMCVEQCGCPADTPLWHETQGCIAEATCATVGVDEDQDGYPEGDDCDDTNAGVYPGAVEVCNDQDDNCDGVIDEGCGVQAEKNLCASTGGTWTDCVGGCGPYNCDNEPVDNGACPAVCVEGCACPVGFPYWSPTEGCFHPDDCAGDTSPDPNETGDNGGCAGGEGSVPLWVFLALALGGVLRRRILREG